MSEQVKKLYSNSWAAPLTPDQRWELYEKAVTCRSWERVAAWAVQEYKLEKMPSRAAWFRWMRIMHKGELEHKLEEVKTTTSDIRKICAKNGVTEEQAIQALLGEACSSVFERGKPKEAIALVTAAMSIKREGTDMKKFEEIKRRNDRLEAEREQLKKVASGEENLTDEEVTAKMREILGV